jgi:hypothetical protein
MTANVPERLPRWVEVVVFCLAVAMPLVYAGVTQHVWEDYYITFKHSRNLVEGQGLVFHPGERVHGFTSPIGTLGPALFYWVSGRSFDGALWLWRVASAVAFGGAVVLMLGLGRDLGRHGKWLAVLAAVWVMVDAKSIMYAANGMETAFMLLFLGLGLRTFSMAPERGWVWWGVSLAGLQWTRPDGVVYGLALAVALLLFGEGKRVKLLIGLGKASVLAGVLYAPWVLWAWWYYGSPIPNTMLAKSMVLGYVVELVMKGDLAGLWNEVLRWGYVARCIGGPIGWEEFWPVWLGRYVTVVAVAAATAVLVPARWGMPVVSKVGSVIFIVLVSHLLMAYFPAAWYMPPIMMAAGVAVAGWVGVCLQSKMKVLGVVAVGGAVALVAGGVYLAVATTRQMAAQQRIVETGMRKEIGLWLKANSRPGERVFLECLGYIGYFSECRMLDFPGLAAPEVWKAMRAEKLEFADLPERFKPEWMVLRFRERQEIAGRFAGFGEQYELAKVFSKRREINALREEIHGLGYLTHDEEFYVYRRVAR